MRGKLGRRSEIFVRGRCVVGWGEVRGASGVGGGGEGRKGKDEEGRRWRWGSERAETRGGEGGWRTAAGGKGRGPTTGGSKTRGVQVKRTP